MASSNDFIILKVGELFVNEHCNLVKEYPDAGKFASVETANRIATGVSRRFNVIVEAWENYGLDTEHCIFSCSFSKWKGK